MDAQTNDTGSLDVMVLYPDGLARARVMAVLQRIHHKLWPAFQFNVNWARFAHLEDPMIRQFLQNAVIKADILCVGTRNRAELPETVKRWLSVMQYPQDHRLLVALLDISDSSAGSEPPRAASFLESFATTRQMDFLPHYTTDLATHTAQDSVANPAAQVIAPFLPQPHRRYPAESSSLNE